MPQAIEEQLEPIAGQLSPLAGQLSPDEEYEQFIKKTIRQTPEKSVEDRLKKLFGASWKESTGGQKTRKVADILLQMVGGEKVGQAERTRRKATEEYKTVTPVLGRESAVISSDQRAAEAQKTARLRNDVARISALAAKQNADTKQAYSEAMADIAAGNLQLGMDKFNHAQKLDEQAWRKLSGDAQATEYYQELLRKDPAQAYQWIQGFSDLSMIKGLSRGAGQGGTTTSTGQFMTPMLNSQTGGTDIISVPRTTTTTRTPAGGGLQERQGVIQGILDRARQQSGAPMQQTPQGPQMGQPGQQMPGMQPPQPAPGPGAQLQQMIQPPVAQQPAMRPSAPIGGAPGAQVMAQLGPQYSKTQPEQTQKTITADREIRVSGLARALPEWYASGNLDNYIGTPEGWIEGARKKLGASNEMVQTIDWVITKGVPAEINETSGLQFSQKEMEQAQKYWPTISDHPKTIMQRMNMINMTVQGNRYIRELGLTPRQRDLLAGEWFKTMEQTSARIVDMTEKAKGKRDWKSKLPSSVDMDPRVVVALAIRKVRAERPKDFPLPGAR